MILFHCDICEKPLSVYQAITLSTMQVTAVRGAPMQQAKEINFDVCSRPCFLEAMRRMAVQVLKESFLP